GVDLRQKLSNRQRSEIHDAFLAHCAIYIRDQELAGADLLRYARYFAEPAELKNVAGRWHSDTTYLEKPPIGTMLYAREVPAYGGDTMVANQYLAYEALSSGMQRMLDGLIGVYSAGADRTGREENKNMKMRNTDKTESFVAEPPAVRTHPETGRK